VAAGLGADAGKKKKKVGEGREKAGEIRWGEMGESIPSTSNGSNFAFANVSRLI